MQALAFAGLFAGVLLLIGGFTGSSVASVAKGAPDHARAGGAVPAPTASTSSGTVSTGGAGPSSSSSSAWRSTLRGIAQARGWSARDWEQVVQLESGGDPTARNPSSGAFGLGQFLGATAQEYAPQGALSHNPVLQIKAMGAYIAARYGNPTKALEHERRFHWY